MVTAPLIFFSSSGQSLFFVNQKGSSMVAVAYLGPPQSFERAARELMAYARDRKLNLMIIAEEGHADRLRKLGFARSPVGVWQSITDTRSFSLHAPGMRRLRSTVSSYVNRGDTRLEEYRVGSDADVDRRFVQLMEEWVGRKKRKAPFVSLLRDLVLSGRLPPRHRVFLTRRGDEIDGVSLLSPLEALNGYLLDLEFYPADMPHGCLEFSIVNAIELLKREGRSYFSFGATYGTQLDPDPHETRIRELLEAFHRKGILNEDGNFNFKKNSSRRRSACTSARCPTRTSPRCPICF
jgi:polyketide synthase PksN